MENQLRFDLKLSLKEIAFRRMAVILWNQVDILSSFQKLPFKLFPDYKCEIEWRETVENKIKARILKLMLPNWMVEQIMVFVRPIGLEILRWKMFHEKFLGIWCDDFDIRIIEHLVWTSAGSIDYQKSAEEIIRLEMLNTVKHYKLSSLYCLEDKIPGFWNELPEKTKNCFYKEEVALQLREHQMENCWAFVLRKGGTPESRFVKPDYFCQYAFESSAVKGNKTAAEYFFQRLTHEEKIISLVRTAKAVLAYRDAESHGSRYDFPKEKLSEVFCYLLFQMTPEQQMQIFHECSFDVLRCFLDWPWKDLFSDMANLFWTYLPENKYEHLLDVISSNIRHASYCFADLFGNFFPICPRNFRKCFVDRECRSGSFFPKIFFFEDTETAKVIFRNVDLEDRVRLVSCTHFFELVDRLMMTERWDLVELCLREATLTKKDINRVKEAYTEYLRSTFLPSLDFRESNRQRVFEFLDESDARS